MGVWHATEGIVPEAAPPTRLARADDRLWRWPARGAEVADLATTLPRRRAAPERRRASMPYASICVRSARCRC